MCDFDNAGEYLKKGLVQPRPKEKREQNPEYLDFIRRQPCCNCLCFFAEPHHVKSRGSGGPDTGNTIPMCRMCHTLAESGHISKTWQRIEATRYHEKYNTWKSLEMSVKGLNQDVAAIKWCDWHKDMDYNLNRK